MDTRALMFRMMRKEFGNLLNMARIKVVTVASVDWNTLSAVVSFAEGDAIDPATDQQTVHWIESYTPTAGDLACLLIAEGAPVLIGVVELKVWNDFSLPTGYTTVAGYTVPGYRRDSNGRVWLRGACNVAASNGTGVKFTFPAGYRPTSGTRMLSAPYSNGTAILDHLRYNVATNGNMSSVLATPAATVFMGFEGLSFDVF